MKKSTFPGILHLVLFSALILTSGLLFGGRSDTISDTASFFLYIDYYGTRYNQGARQMEYCIKAVKLPAHLLKKMPRLKNYGQYSEKNRRIYLKQQDLIRPYRGNNMTLRIDQDKLKDFYPEVLKKGFVIEESEFKRWDFIEKPREHPDSIRNRLLEDDEMEWYYYYYYFYYFIFNKTYIELNII
jgi:hypothetical protein